MSDQKMLTLHPEGKQGVNINQAKYDTVKSAILDALRGGELTFSALTDEVYRRLNGSFDGSIMWYVTTIKLDLEARGLIERVPRSSPQRLRIAP